MSKHVEKRARELLAENVRRLREARGISQEKLAADAGFHRTFVSQVERQVNSVILDNLEKLATALEVEPWVLLRPPRRVPKAPEQE
jgi:transcriptional regulator with XRE-family HTH domain